VGEFSPRIGYRVIPLDSMDCFYLHSIGDGPVQIVWRHSRLANPKVVAEKLRETLPCNTQVFGFQELEIKSSGVYTYRMVLWPSALPDNSTEEELPARNQNEILRLMQWRSGVRLAVTELERLSLKSASESSKESRWSIKSCWHGVHATDSVKDFVRALQLQERDDGVVFGEIAYEYEVDGRRWYEVHCCTAEGSYVHVMVAVPAKRGLAAS
jgi:hypothetical protein